VPKVLEESIHATDCTILGWKKCLQPSKAARKTKQLPDGEPGMWGFGGVLGVGGGKRTEVVGGCLEAQWKALV